MSDTISSEDQSSSTPQPTMTTTTATRSYECNFCKRGFTNAQALGGHMNIHRKDKAKLKQLANNYSVHRRETEPPRSQQSSPSTDILKRKIDQYSSYSSPNLPMMNSSLERSDNNTNTNTNISPSDDHGVNNLFLINQGTTLLDDHIYHDDHDGRDQNQPDDHERSSVAGRGSSDSELDLELRLGPQDVTRKFF